MKRKVAGTCCAKIVIFSTINIRIKFNDDILKAMLNLCYFVTK